MRTPSFAIAMLLALTAHAQIDSVKTTYKTEDAAISKSEIKRFIRYITRADIEEKTLIKVGFWPGANRDDISQISRFRAGLNSEITIEQKLTPSISLLGGVEGFWRYADYGLPTSTLPTGIDPGTVRTVVRSNSLELQVKTGLRYYHSMAGRIRRGLSANNFNGNYIGIVGSQILRQNANIRLFDWRNGSVLESKENYNLTGATLIRVAAQYGVQRRLGRLGYVDISAGPEVFLRKGLSAQISLQLNALIGLGW